jgi:DNA-binding LacI/PurR family transcriptional regulator
MIMTDKIHRRLDSLNYATMVFAAYNYMFNMDSLNPIMSRKVDGIITFLEPSLEVVETCKNNNIPIILLGRKNTRLEIDSVSTDDYAGGFKVGELFIKNGVKNVGYLGAPREIECSVRRQNGLRDAFLKYNQPYHEENIRYMAERSMFEEIDILLKNHVDGIFFFNDLMAFEGMKYLKEKEYKVPNRIKVVGYDDIAQEFPIPVSLTTVASDKDLIVNTAVDILYYKMQNKEKNSIVKALDIDVEVKLGSTI